MASLSREPNGRYTVQISMKCHGGPVEYKRHSIRLGDVSKKTAQEIRTKIEALANSKENNFPVDQEVSRWCATIGDQLAGKLFKAGLIPKREKSSHATFRDVISRFIASKQKTNARPRSITNYQQAAKKLYARFGESRAMSSVTSREAEEWIAEMRERYAVATVSRLIKFAKQFYNVAKKEKLLTETPFDDIRSGSMANPSRVRFVSREEIAQVISKCPDVEWRLIVSLARFGGLRCPSEVFGLTWGDIDWQDNKFNVNSTKTGFRIVPLFPELRPHLEEAFDLAAEGSVHVISQYRSNEKNLRTRFERIIKRAGLEPWERLFQNLRASRETELAAEHPLHVAAAWIGNSPVIAAKHYLSVTAADYAKAVQNPVCLAVASSVSECRGDNELPGNNQKDVVYPVNSSIPKYTRRDSNNMDNSRHICNIRWPSGVKSGAKSTVFISDPELHRLIEHIGKIWPGLNAEARAAIASGVGLVESGAN